MLPTCRAPGVARQLAADQHDFAAHVGGRGQVQIAADHDDAVADAAVDGRASRRSTTAASVTSSSRSTRTSWPMAMRAPVNL